MPVWFLAIFDKSMFSFLKLRLYFFPFFQGKNAQNKPKNHQNGNLTQIAPKSDKFMNKNP